MNDEMRKSKMDKIMVEAGGLIVKISENSDDIREMPEFTKLRTLQKNLGYNFSDESCFEVLTTCRKIFGEEKI